MDTTDRTDLSNRELIEALATEVMGWKKHRKKPDRPEWDWDWFEVTDTELIQHSSYWDPLSDWNHTMEVVARMSSRRFHWELRNEDENGLHRATFCPFGGEMGDCSAAVCRDPQRALCLAALSAARSK